jgi:hypothetical protein
MDVSEDRAGEKRKVAFEAARYNPETGRWEGTWLTWYQVLKKEDKNKLVCGV